MFLDDPRRVRSPKPRQNPDTQIEKGKGTHMNKREDKGFFTQLPIVLIDEYSDKMPATSFVAFVRFYRHYGYKGIFKGSIRKLCHALGMAIGSVYRAIGHWVACGLVRKGEQKKMDENRNEMVLLIEGNDLWKRNIEHSKSLQGCSKLEQSAPAEENTVPENKGSVPDWNNNVPKLNDFVPASSSKSPPYITKDYLKITQEDKTEDSDESPTPSTPDDSSFNSSDLNLNSSQEDSGLHIASQASSPQNSDNSPPPACPDTTNSSGVETQDGDAYTPSYSKDYMKDNNHVVPDRDDFVPPDAVEQWVNTLASKERFFDLGKPEKREDAIDQLESIVASEKDLRGLYDAAREIYGGIIHLTNLTHLRVINAWLETKPEYEPSGQGMTLEERNQARQDVWDYCEDIALNQCEEQGRWFVGVFYSKDGYFELGAPGDWKRVPNMWKAWAVQYGRRLSEPQQQREAIAV